eukprot:m.2997 g.2997  ORF g.2997 m.2997 type:complete len:69 (+) comp2641_c0_seq1:3283-3489(+)
MIRKQVASKTDIAVDYQGFGEIQFHFRDNTRESKPGQYCVQIGKRKNKQMCLVLGNDWVPDLITALDN